CKGKFGCVESLKETQKLFENDDNCGSSVDSRNDADDADS
ncbi:3880_t:CDS:1, partial [Dentiscutata heterogama]